MKFLTQILNSDRLFTILYENLPAKIKSSQLYEQVAVYLEKYAKFNNIAVENAISIYSRYISVYNKDCKHFIKTGKYPLEDGINNFSISREEYDIVLLLSVLFTEHRFRIMQLIQQQSSEEKALFIGLGPGLELALTKDKYSEIYAYDLSVNKFLLSEFPEVQFNSELYHGQKESYFNVIYLIELLEHLKDPLNLLRTCFKSLKESGKIILTTATNIPQFDHLYNFELNHSNFEEQLRQIGFEVLQKEMITHIYLTMKLKPCNHFYIIEK